MHLKRIAAPREIKVPRKEKKFIVRPMPGPHPLEKSIPLLVVVRDYLGYASSAAEAKKIIKRGHILIDGRAVREPRFPVGLMDVLSIPVEGKSYRVLPIYRRGLQLVEINGDEASVKLGLVVRKQHVKGGGLQFTLHDGRNVLFKEVSENERGYKVGDTFKITIPDQKVTDHIPRREGNYGLVIAGSKSGLHGRITRVDTGIKYPAKPLIYLETSVGETSTILPHVMAIGDSEPWLKIPQITQ